MNDDEKTVSMLTNAIGWEVFAGDGRVITQNENGVDTVVLTDEETDRARMAAVRVLRELKLVQ